MEQIDTSSVSLKKKGMYAFRWISGVQIVGQLLSWLSTFAVIRLLSPQDYGLMAMANFSLGLLLILSGAGMADGLIQAETNSREQIKKVFGLLIVVNFFLFLIQFFAAYPLSLYFMEERITPLIQTLSLIFLLVPFISVPQALLIRDIEFKGKSIVDLCSIVCNVVTTFILAWKGFGVWSLVIGFLLKNVVLAVGFQILNPTLLKPDFDFRGLGKLILFGSSITVTALIWSFYIKVDVLIAGRTLEPYAIGIYATAIELASMPMVKAMPIINQVAFPIFSRIQKNYSLIIKSYRSGVLLVSILAFPMIIGVAAIAPEFVPLIIGEKWSDIILPMQILCFSIPFRMSQNLLSPILKGIGRADIILINTVFTLFVVSVSIFIGIRWGVNGMAWAWMSSAPIAFFFSLVNFSIIFKIRAIDLLYDFFPAVISSSFMFMIVRLSTKFFIIPNKVLELVIIIIIGIVIYPIIIRFLFPKKFKIVVHKIKNRNS